MKVHDEAAWQRQLADFAADPDEFTPRFKGWIIDWCEAAEKWLESAHNQGIHPDDITPIEALRATLRQVEKDHKHWPAVYLGAALLLICDHWEPAQPQDEFYGSMTVIEQNMFLDVAAEWVASHQQQAAQATNG